MSGIITKAKVEAAKLRFVQKLKEIEMPDKISAYTRAYLMHIANNSAFYVDLYVQMLDYAFKNNDFNTKSVVVDYGGGSGMLSFFLSLAGFRNIIYIDIYEQSVIDAKVISKHYGFSNQISFVCGTETDLTVHLASHSLALDLLVSSDVIEHIYNIKNFLTCIMEVMNTNAALVFTSGANRYNPFTFLKLRRAQLKAENYGFKGDETSKPGDELLPFALLRSTYIDTNFGSRLNKKEVKALTKRSRGLIYNDIHKLVENYLNTGTLPKKVRNLSNTCDPSTGNWHEQMLDLKQIQQFCLTQNRMARITGGLYCMSGHEKKILRFIKKGLNLILNHAGKFKITIAPFYILAIEHKKSRL